MKFDNQNVVTNTNYRIQETHSAQTNAVNENANIIDLSMATEFLDNPATKEEIRKARAKKVEQLINLMINDGGICSSDDEKRQLFKEIKKLNDFISTNMGKIDFDALEYEANNNKRFQDKFNELINGDDNKNNKNINDIKLVLSKLLPESDIFNRVFDLIKNVDTEYVAPYQELAEIGSEMYAEFAKFSAVMSKMISSGTINTETNLISLDLTEFKTSLDAFYHRLYSPESPMVKKLKAMQFLPSQLDKAKELVLSTGFVLAGGPPSNTHYWLEVNPATKTNLDIAWTGVAGNNPGSLFIELSTYGLQALQTTVNATGDSLASDMQTAAEKFKRVISTSDAITKLLSAFISACYEANKAFFG